ncbi:MAG: sugar O-acetyltransferase [Clostridiales bacterium]|nr:sugar O-acetyltransferase [Clostridiales bacterium]
MTEKERMLAGKLYRPFDPQLGEEHQRKWRLVRAINSENDRSRLPGLFRELLGSIKEGSWIEPPFYCDYGSHITIGRHVYANCDCILLDVCEITIGDDVYIAPRVCVFTAAHPIDAGVRNVDLEYGKPVKIGNSVWIGGNTVINPGVTIGDNVVIGAGSVVTHDIPSGVVAAGNPCRVIRPITGEDRAYWEGLAAEYWAEHPSEPG